MKPLLTIEHTPTHREIPDSLEFYENGVLSVSEYNNLSEMELNKDQAVELAKCLLKWSGVDIGRDALLGCYRKMVDELSYRNPHANEWVVAIYEIYKYIEENYPE